MLARPPSVLAAGASTASCSPRSASRGCVLVRAEPCCSRRRPPTVRCADAPADAAADAPAECGRRAWLATAAAALAASQLLAAHPAAAENAYTAWWRSRRTANGGAKLLNPLYVAQRRLREANDLLGQSPPGVEDVTAALQLVRSSSLNCYIFDALPDDSIETKASLLTAQLELSDPCTWRIVLKNTVDLEPPEVQAAASEKMEALVLSYQHLDSLLDWAREGNMDAVPKAQEQLKTTMRIASDIEAFVKQTLFG